MRNTNANKIKGQYRAKKQNEDKRSNGEYKTK